MHHKFIDQYSHLDSFLHRVDPRVKMIVFLAIVCCVVLTPVSCPQLLCFYGAMILSMVFVSKLPWHFILMKPLVFLPFAAFLGLSLCFEPGAARFWFFVFILSRSFLAILCMVLLVSTTPFVDLLKGLQEMRCPRLFLMIFSFMYRYFYLFSDQLMKMNRSRESRSMGKRWWSDIKALANMAGSLFVKSYETSEGVYLAMCARGYRGQIRATRLFTLHAMDYGFMFGIFLYLFLVNAGGYFYVLCH